MEGGEKPVSQQIEAMSAKKDIVKSAVKFAAYLTSRYPQVNDGRRMWGEIDERGTRVELPELPESIEAEPRLNYYLAGSLSTMLLSQAESFTELDPDRIPAMSTIKTTSMPQETREALMNFARPIGDLDYVPMEHYKDDPNRLRKGGGGPSFSEIPEDARQVLRIGENQQMLMCDPLSSYGPHRIARVSLDGKEYYIARPDTMIGYKILHLLQGYESNPERFNDDFANLLTAVETVYNRGELLEVTYKILVGYEDAMRASHERGEWEKEYESKLRGWIETTLKSSGISPEIRLFLDDLRELDVKERRLLQ